MVQFPSRTSLQKDNRHAAAVSGIPREAIHGPTLDDGDHRKIPGYRMGSLGTSQQHNTLHPRQMLRYLETRQTLTELHFKGAEHLIPRDRRLLNKPLATLLKGDLPQLQQWIASYESAEQRAISIAAERTSNLREERMLMKRWLQGNGTQDGRAIHYTVTDNDPDNTNDIDRTNDTSRETADQDLVC